MTRYEELVKTLRPVPDLEEKGELLLVDELGMGLV